MDILGKILRLQKERGWNRKQLAKRSGLSVSTISMMYVRNNQPTISTLQALCAAFGITLSQFFSEDHVPPCFTPEQKKLLRHWNRLSEEQKTGLLALIQCL
ncbi:MAG: helix-turn-helix domain-containing protein [Oscillospiraceae bacterium]|nr:helix-turn-helix domain-containing protein [Oscillospiraceae bacterium]